jgi:hypothetical protein
MPTFSLSFFLTTCIIFLCACRNDQAEKQAKQQYNDSLLLSDYNRNMADIRDILDTMAQIANNPNVSSKTVKEKAESAKIELSKKIEKIENLEKELNQANSAIKNDAQFLAVVRDVQRLSKSQEKQLEAMAQGASSREGMSQAASSLMSATTKIEAQGKTIASLERKVINLGKANAFLTEENELIRKENERIKKENERLRIDSAATAAIIAELQAEKQKFNEILNVLKKQINEANTAAEKAKQEQIYELLADGFNMFQSSKTMKEGSFWTGKNKKQKQTLNKSQTIVQAYDNFCKAYQLGHVDAYNHMQNLKNDKTTKVYLKNVECS